MSSPRIVLGSESKWRKQLLEAAGLEFTTAAAKIDEKAINVGGCCTRVVAKCHDSICLS